jgi:hypothetical protein
LFTVLVAWTPAATGQQSPAQPDSARAQIHTTLRAFYFNLAHRDVEALTADILAAKVVAHRPAPDALLAASSSSSGPAGQGAGDSSAVEDLAACCSEATPLLDQATIALEGDWAEVSVPRCIARLAGADRFRLIRFKERWRFVNIHLFQQPVNVSADR